MGLDTPRTRIAIGLSAGTALGALYLLFGPDPWSVEGGPGFFAEDRHRPLRSNIVIGLWWAAAMNTALCAVLLATHRWWTRPAAPPATRTTPTRTLAPRLFWAGVLLAVATGVAARVPVASKSVWWDEGWTIRTLLVGAYLGPEDDPSAWEFREGSLMRAFFYGKRPTNHALYSVAAWATLEPWRRATTGPPERFSELAYRLPALIASALAILLVGLLARSMGFPHAAVLAAWLFALHPWAIRHGGEGRGYALAIAFSGLAAFALMRWLTSLSWRDLGLYVVAQIALVWAWFYAAFLCAALGVAGLLCIAASRQPAADRAALAGRFAVAHVVAAMVTIQLLAPILGVSLTWVYPGTVWGVLPNVWALMSTGMLIESSVGPGHVMPSLPFPGDAGWATAIGIYALLPLLAIWGTAAIARRSITGRVAMLGWIASAPLSWIVTHLLGRQFYPRFQVYLLPIFVIVATVGLWRLGEVLSEWGRARFGARGRLLGVGVASVLVAAWGFLVAPQFHLVLTRPWAPLRDVAEVVAEQPDALVAGLGMGTGMVRLYHPHVLYMDDLDDIRARCQQAEEAGRPLLAFYGYAGHNAKRADAIALLEDPEAFERIAQLEAILPQFRYRVFRAIPGGTCPP